MINWSLVLRELISAALLFNTKIIDFFVFYFFGKQYSCDAKYRRLLFSPPSFHNFILTYMSYELYCKFIGFSVFSITTVLCWMPLCCHHYYAFKYILIVSEWTWKIFVFEAHSLCASFINDTIINETRDSYL